jgi:uncharacterized damage-inducible protein DinB
VTLSPVSAAVVRELVTGKGAHADALASVEGIPLAVAGAAVPGLPWTIYGLVWHAAYWMEYEAKRLDGQSPVYPDHAEESWPQTLAPADEAEWTAAVAWFRRGIEDLLARAALPPAEAGRAVDRTHSGSNQGATVADVVVQTLVHNSYHVGQIVLLRQALGAWPPPAGRDTW